jgi:hypothetical protein
MRAWYRISLREALFFTAAYFAYVVLLWSIVGPSRTCFLLVPGFEILQLLLLLPYLGLACLLFRQALTIDLADDRRRGLRQLLMFLLSSFLLLLPLLWHILLVCVDDIMYHTG